MLFQKKDAKKYCYIVLKKISYFYEKLGFKLANDSFVMKYEY
jgi:hypothetical protein